MSNSSDRPSDRPAPMLPVLAGGAGVRSLTFTLKVRGNFAAK